MTVVLVLVLALVLVLVPVLLVLSLLIGFIEVLTHRLRNGVGTNGLFTEGPHFISLHFAIACFNCASVATSCHMFYPFEVFFCRIWYTRSRESSFGGIAPFVIL